MQQQVPSDNDTIYSLSKAHNKTSQSRGVSQQLLLAVESAINDRAEDCYTAKEKEHHSSRMMEYNQEIYQHDGASYFPNENSNELKSEDVFSKDAEKKQKKIPRPQNAFFLFAQEQRKNLTESHPYLKNCAISARLGVMWQHMPAEEKQVYIDRARALELQHREKYPDYVYKPLPKKERAKRGKVGRPRKYPPKDTDQKNKSGSNQQHYLPQAPLLMPPLYAHPGALQMVGGQMHAAPQSAQHYSLMGPVYMTATPQQQLMNPVGMQYYPQVPPAPPHTQALPPLQSQQPLQHLQMYQQQPPASNQTITSYAPVETRCSTSTVAKVDPNLKCPNCAFPLAGFLSKGDCQKLPKPKEIRIKVIAPQDGPLKSLENLNNNQCLDQSQTNVKSRCNNRANTEFNFNGKRVRTNDEIIPDKSFSESQLSERGVGRFVGSLTRSVHDSVSPIEENSDLLNTFTNEDGDIITVHSQKTNNNSVESVIRHFKRSPSTDILASGDNNATDQLATPNNIAEQQSLGKDYASYSTDASMPGQSSFATSMATRTYQSDVANYAAQALPASASAGYNSVPQQTGIYSQPSATQVYMPWAYAAPTGGSGHASYIYQPAPPQYITHIPQNGV